MLRTLLAALVLASAAGPAVAQYPVRPVTMVVPFPAGGNTDLMGRALQETLRKTLNQTVVVINKGGASGTLGLADVVRNDPDGYTLALTPNNPLTAQPHIQKPPFTMESFRRRPRSGSWPKQPTSTGRPVSSAITGLDAV